jgi:hypothetical protein
LASTAAQAQQPAQPAAAQEQDDHQDEPARQQQMDGDAQRLVQRVRQPGARVAEQVHRLRPRRVDRPRGRIGRVVAENAQGDRQPQEQQHDGGQVEAGELAFGHDGHSRDSGIGLPAASLFRRAGNDERMDRESLTFSTILAVSRDRADRIVRVARRGKRPS